MLQAFYTILDFPALICLQAPHFWVWICLVQYPQSCMSFETSKLFYCEKTHTVVFFLKKTVLSSYKRNGNIIFGLTAMFYTSMPYNGLISPTHQQLIYGKAWSVTFGDITLLSLYRSMWWLHKTSCITSIYFTVLWVREVLSCLCVR